jgi:hypothetical protein
MESAERKGLLFRRELLSADRFKDAAIRSGSRNVKTPFIEAQRIAVFGHMSRPTPTFPRRPGAVALAPGASPRCSCFPCHRATTCKWLSLRLNASAQAMFRADLRRPPAAQVRRRFPETHGPEMHANESSILRPH